MIAPVFEQLASEKGIKLGGGGSSSGAVFAKIDMSIPAGNQLAGEWGVRVMPTFMFFLDGKKVCRCAPFYIHTETPTLDRRNERS